MFLHGQGGNERTELDAAFFSALASLGPRAPVVALPYGGDSSYWHDRKGGRWGAYVVREVIPTVTRRFGTDPRRVAIGGISMGGFGALDLARLNRGRFCAVAGHSPAIWTTARETTEGAFDNAEDFARHDVVTAASSRASWAARPCGSTPATQTPSSPAYRPSSRASARPGHPSPSGHGRARTRTPTWNKHWRDYARFYARALERVR